jgi:uncharacterized membrane protein YgdD (TMEM256/DUF423 family)
MTQAARLFLLLGAVNAALVVALGAFGAHALKTRLPQDLMAVYQTGIQYHFYHAVGLILIGLAATQIPASLWLKGAGWLMLAGIVIFSGSLYALSLSGLRWLGVITPIGGTALILAWIFFAAAVIKAP